MRIPEWRRAGLRFECTGCGDCCRREGIVKVSVAECRRMATHMAMPLDLFMKSYTKKDKTYGLLLKPASSGRMGCVMLDGDGKCTVHEAKPIQCSTYPFWASLLESEESWNEEAQNECEGMNRGNLIPPEEITRRLLQKKR